ncbi:MAG: multicopper oxidase domain-containing protein [Caldilineaceae bacterium]
MHTSRIKRIRLGVVLLLLLGLLSGSPLALPQTAAAQSQPTIGIACTSGPTFTLDAKAGYIILADGNTMYMWSYAPGGAAFQYPGLVLCVTEGDTVTVVLNNTLTEDTSIVFPGQENVLANGAPAQPQFNGTTLTSLTNVAPVGGSVTYSFVAAHPGTYIYESGTSPEKQVRMGLAGVLIVRPRTVPNGGASANPSNYAYDRADSQFTPEEEFLVFLSEIDPYQHQAAEQNKPYDLTKYHVHYWLVNGRTFPDTIADNFAPYLPSQPYGALARVHPFDATAHPFPGMARYVNVGFEEVSFHPHGNNGAVIARDGTPLEATAGGADLSFEKFAINIGPGQTWDVLFRWYDAENYSESNPVPVTIPDLANQTLGMFWGGSPYLGVQGTLPPGASTLNQCGEYYIISHNHALFQLDAWGLTMAGQITYMRVDPPLPNSCP